MLFTFGSSLKHGNAVATLIPKLAVVFNRANCPSTPKGSRGSAMNLINNYEKGDSDFNHRLSRLQTWIYDGTTISLRQKQLFTYNEKSPKVGSLSFRDSSELRISDLLQSYFIYYSYFTASQNGPTNRWELVLRKVLHTVPEKWFYWLTVRLIPISFHFCAW
jgi:hypothetical protein